MKDVFIVNIDFNSIFTFLIIISLFFKVINYYEEFLIIYKVVKFYFIYFLKIEYYKVIYFIFI